MNQSTHAWLALVAVAVMAVVALAGCPVNPGDTKTFAGIDFVWCPPGTFTMGAYPGELDAQQWEGPQHEVTISKGFWMGKYEITQAQWKAVMGGKNPSFFQSAASATYDHRPVESVSWDDTQVFIKALNSAYPRMGFRLPSEAEWEYACRAGTTTRFYWGDDLDYTEIGDYAWYGDNSDRQTHDVGGKLPNAWRLYDMSGNVLEWVQDRYAAYTNAPVTDPIGPENSGRKIFRGGFFAVDPGYCRSAYRSNDRPPGIMLGNIGFRLARFTIP